MSTLVMTAANQAGSALVQAAQQTALSYANRALSNFFDTRNFQGPRLESFLVQTSRDGAPMARVYGRVRLAGQVIWASQLLETDRTESAGGKGGGPTRTDYSYSVSFAVGFCEGEILSIERIWANGVVLDTQGLTYRVYKGTADQNPDPVLSAVEGADVPAFRDTAYILFEDFPLDDYGARLPQINVEIIRTPKERDQSPRLESLVQGVNLLPSSGEYAYSPKIAEEIFGPGTAKALNMNNYKGVADFTKAVDQLQNELPNCRSVSIIISWFGTDLRCGLCEIKPGVETETRYMRDAPWSVGAQNRETAYRVSQDPEGRPNFGGTPSDASLIDAIMDLKSRGYKVSLYPFILMDIPSDNMRADPYGATTQAAFPWRGRISCFPAPGQPGSPEKTPAILPEIEAFFGTTELGDFSAQSGTIDYSGPNTFGFRRFILHYAKLAQLAGGVDRFIIGSEMRGVTTLRSATHTYPAVDQLIRLASDVRSLLGDTTELSYAADWSEYFGHHPQDGSGDVSFHLDPLWASSNIDAIGIDAYFPLSDWREGTVHLDAQSADHVYDRAYLASNMEGGEGYDWYYANASDRTTQTRSSISDGLGKPWVFRYKDIRNWWANPHYNRTAGLEEAVPTAWLAQSKPIWFTEIGCPAIDKGSNQPNVFVDPKSSESFTPYHSTGLRDDLIQRRYLETFLDYWSPETGQNPISTVTAKPMIDLSATHVWCWDARPYPEFPALTQVWSDGENWALGHWLNGRTGLVPLADVVSDLSYRAGAKSVDVTRVIGTLQGYVLDRPLSTRAALEPLASIYGFNLVESADRLRFVSFGAEATLSLSLEAIAGESDADIEYGFEDQTLRLRDVRLRFINGGDDYQIGSVSARDLSAETVRVLDLDAPLVLSPSYARYITDHILNRAQHSGTRLTFTLPLNALTVEVGDLLEIEPIEGAWRVETLETAEVLSLTVRRDAESFRPTVSGSTPQLPSAPLWTPEPHLVLLDIPGGEDRTGPLLGAYSEPFSRVEVQFGEDTGSPSVTLARRVKWGVLLSPLSQFPVGRIDPTQSFTAQFKSGTFSSVTHAAFLSGGNRFALQTALGWEIIQARDVELIAPQTYRFKTFLRGLFGSEAEQTPVIEAGAEIVALPSNFETLAVKAEQIGTSISLFIHAAGRAVGQSDFVYQALHLRPLVPVQGRIMSKSAGLEVTWIRQTRINGDNWNAVEVPLGEAREFYKVTLFSGENLFAELDAQSPKILIDFETLASADRVFVAQGSDTYGFGPALEISIPK